MGQITDHLADSVAFRWQQKQQWKLVTLLQIIQMQINNCLWVLSSEFGSLVGTHTTSLSFCVSSNTFAQCRSPVVCSHSESLLRQRIFHTHSVMPLKGSVGTGDTKHDIPWMRLVLTLSGRICSTTWTSTDWYSYMEGRTRTKPVAQKRTAFEEYMHGRGTF
jgi:hypothetical protein